MSITIKRNTGRNGIASKIHIRLNGKEVGSIMEKKEIEVEIPEDESNLEVTRFGNKSNKIVVKDGDVVEITSTDFYRKGVSLSLPIGIIMGIIIILVPNLIYRLIIVTAYLVVISIAQLYFKLFNIKVVTDGISENS